MIVSYNGCHILEDIEPARSGEAPNYGQAAMEAARGVRRGRYEHLQANIMIIGSGLLILLHSMKLHRHVDENKRPNKISYLNYFRLIVFSHMLQLFRLTLMGARGRRCTCR